jgi:hypothetical protein
MGWAASSACSSCPSAVSVDLEAASGPWKLLFLLPCLFHLCLSKTLDTLLALRFTSNLSQTAAVASARWACGFWVKKSSTNWMEELSVDMPEHVCKMREKKAYTLLIISENRRPAYFSRRWRVRGVEELEVQFQALDRPPGQAHEICDCTNRERSFCVF